MAMSTLVTLTERRQRFVELRGVADHKNGELIFVYILFRHAGEIGGRDLFDASLKALQKVGGVSVELIGHAFAQHFVG